MRRPTVFMASTSYPENLLDWKGLFIRHLCDALAESKDLTLQLWAPPGETHPLIARVTTNTESDWLSKLMARGGIAHIVREGGIAAVTTPLRLLWLLNRAYKRMGAHDLYHINWLQNALALPNDGKPIIVSALGTDMKLLDLPFTKHLLRQVFKRHPTIICPNAEWMVEPLKSIFSGTADVNYVPFGIDPTWFAIERKATPPNTTRWLAVTRLTNAKLGPLFEWCAPLFQGQARELHLFGPMQETIDLPSWVHYHGPASPMELSALWFPSAHGLITLSRHAEGRPQVMLEAMAAELPIIASTMPAHANIVFHGKTGWLCDSPESVVDGIRHFENWAENRRAGVSARNWVNKEMGTWADCAGRYTKLYERLLEVRNRV